MPYISLVFPAYNEAKNITAAVGDAQQYFSRKGFTYQIIVSADGNDGTREMAGELARSDPRITVIGSPERRGKGRGVRDGIALARGQIVGYCDADNKTPLNEIDKFLPHFAQGCQVVIGSRAMTGSLFDKERPLYRRLGSYGYRMCTHMITGLWGVTDTQCGLKLFTGEAAHKLFDLARIDGYSFDVEILFLARRAGYKIAQVPVLFHHDPDSRMDLIRGNLRSMMDLLRIRRIHG